MHYRNLIITAPAVKGSGQSEAEIFGLCVWLWMHAPRQRDMPLHALSQRLLPPLRLQQFILASEVGVGGRITPVAYVAWAQLTAEAESRYVDNPATGLTPDDWLQGNRMWITDFFCPFGHARDFIRAALSVLPHSCFRALYHRGGERGLRVLNFRGHDVSREQEKNWWQDKPILARKGNQLKEVVTSTTS